MNSEVLAFYITMILAGYIMMTMIYGLAAFISVKIKFLKCSTASFIAAFFVSMPFSLALNTLLPADLKELGSWASWIVALFMFGSMLIFVFWLKAFEPDSIEVLTIKKLREMELLKLKIERKELKRLIKLMKQNNAIQDQGDYSERLKGLKNAEKMIKVEYKIPGIFSRFKTGFSNITKFKAI